jgi:plastocyanin
MALALRMNGEENKRYVYTLMSDGECDEGNTWEAVMLAGKYKLHNLIAIIDRNNIQIDGFTEDTMPLENFYAKYGQPGKDRTPTNESGATLVLYRGTNGFVPSVLHVKLGTSVVFRNDSSESLRIASNPLSNYPELDSKNMIQPGAEYSFTFQRIGWWIIISAFGNAKRLPFLPDDKRTEAAEAARPTQVVITSDFT